MGILVSIYDQLSEMALDVHALCKATFDDDYASTSVRLLGIHNGILSSGSLQSKVSIDECRQGWKGTNTKSTDNLLTTVPTVSDRNGEKRVYTVPIYSTDFAQIFTRHFFFRKNPAFTC